MEVQVTKKGEETDQMSIHIVSLINKQFVKVK